MGLAGNDTLYVTEAGGGAWGGGGDDTIYGGGAGRLQSHIYGGRGNDTIVFDTSDRSAPYGDHVWGGEDSDRFVFINVNEGTERITGRIDDFDITRDEIWIEDQKIDLRNPPEGVRIVEWNDQPWILISDRILYALEGARVNENPAIHRVDEIHFIDWPPPWANGVPRSADIKYEDFHDYFPADKLDRPESAFRHLRGTDGNDVLTGGAGGNWIRGGDGADVLYAGPDGDLIDGGEMHDTIHGGAGRDSIAGGLDHDLIHGGAGNDVVYGGSGKDTVHGDDGNDTLHGNGGDDLVYGGAGNDLIHGGRGNDTLHGGNGNDTIHGGAGNDLIRGGGGDDSLFGGGGNDTLDGGDGNDFLQALSGLNRILAGEGNDTIVAGGGSVVQTGGGEDLVTLSPTGSGPLVIEDLGEDDKIDLTMLSHGEDKALHVIMEQIEVIRGGISETGVLMEFPSTPGASVLLTGGSMAGFRGADSLTGDSGGFMIEDNTDQEPTRTWDADNHRFVSGNGEDDDDDEEDDEEEDEEDEDDDEAGGGGACFVATAAFGDPWHPDVVSMRAFRDIHLRRHRAGRAFIRFYWCVGPVLASITTPGSLHGRVARTMISWLVRRLRARGLAG